MIRTLAVSVVVITLVVFFVLLLSGCVGMVNDYATAANAFGEEATRNTIVQLQRKHDSELAGYAAAYCGQPRIGAVVRRYQDPALRAARDELCRAEQMLGYR